MECESLTVNTRPASLFGVLIIAIAMTGPVVAESSSSYELLDATPKACAHDACTDHLCGWGLFGRAGISDDNPHPIDWSVSFGIGGNSQLRGRQDDKFGIGWYYIGISDEFGPIVSDLLGDVQSVELYYDIALTGAYRLSLDLQVVDPNFLRADTAVVPGVRGRIEF
jgi:porin